MLIAKAPYSVDPPEEWKIRPSVAAGWLMGGIVLIIPIAVSLLFTDTETGIALRAVLSAFAKLQIPSNSRYLAYSTGLVCLVLYFFFCYFYVIQYIETIWNNFFVGPLDRHYLLLVAGVQILGFILACFQPVFWYFNAVIFQFVMFGVVRARLRSLRTQLAENGVAFHTDGPVIPRGAKEAALERETTHLYLLRAAANSTSVKAAVYGGPFIVMLAFSQLFGRQAGSQADYLLTGMYVSASVLFVLLSSARYTTRAMITLSRMHTRATKGDRLYFDTLLR